MSKDSNAQSAGWTVLGDERREHYRISGTTVDMSRPALPPVPITLVAQPQNVIIDLRKTAMIVVDVQNDFCTQGGWVDSLGWDVSGPRKIYPAVRRSADLLRAREVPIVWLNWGVRPDKANLLPSTRYTFTRVGCGVGLGDAVQGGADRRGGRVTHVLQKDAWGSAIVDELAPQPADIYVDKHRVSGFWDTDLDSVLRNLGVRTIFFAGLNADECVLATLMDANFHGYDTILIEDGVFTSSPEYCMQATLYNVRFNFGFTVTSDALIEGLRVK